MQQFVILNSINLFLYFFKYLHKYYSFFSGSGPETFVLLIIFMKESVKLVWILL